LAPGWNFTTRSASTRASAIAHRGKITRKACGYVDDRRCRPAVLPPLPERARKAGKCSPSPTYPQAPHVVDAEHIGQEQRVEFAALEDSCQLDPVVERVVAIAGCAHKPGD
jgi:hypothetical protein